MSTDYNHTTAIIGIAAIGLVFLAVAIIAAAWQRQAARWQAAQASKRKAPRTRRQREVETLNTYARIAIDPTTCVKYGQHFGVPDNVMAAQRPLIDGRVEWDGQREAA